MFHNLRNSIYKRTLSYSALLVLLTGVASADQTLSESFFTTGNVHDASSTGQFTLPAFDTTLGTLEGVDITLTINSWAKLQIYNSSSNPVGFTDASLTLPGSVTGPGNINLMTSLTASLDSGIAKSGLNNFDTDKVTNTASQHVNAGMLSLWENQPDNAINFSYTKGNPTYQGTDLGDSLFFGGSVREKGKLTVDYTYLSAGNLATPEPAGKFLSAIVAGAMMLMLVGRRKLLGA
jgi:hypothetical protein